MNLDSVKENIILTLVQTARKTLFTTAAMEVPSVTTGESDGSSAP